MTVREGYAEPQNYERCFGSKIYTAEDQTSKKIDNFQIYYLCPFNEMQRDTYIENYLKSVKLLKTFHLEFNTFENLGEYQKEFNKNPILRELCKTPFVLRMVMQIFPLLVAEAEINRKRDAESSSVNHTFLLKQSIFEQFVHQYYKNELFRKFVIDQDFVAKLNSLFPIGLSTIIF